MKEIYAIDSTRISCREYWWGTKSPFILIGLLLRFLRIRLPSSTDDPNVASTLPWVVDALPEDVAKRFEPLAAVLSTLGFNPVAYHCIFDHGTQTAIYWTTFVHSSGRHLARIHQRIWSRSQAVSRAIFPVFLTEFNDGTFVVSSSGKPDMLTPETVQMNRMPGAAPDRLWSSHEQRVTAAEAQRQVISATNKEQATAAIERHHVLLRDFNLQRGVFRPQTADEEVRAAAVAASIDRAQANGLQNGDVIAEMERLQNQKPGWKNALWLLVISIIAFVALGAAAWDWKFTLWLIPVLLIHEAGHWLAMKVFRYRNVRMFFIPLFGAAVSGRHWNVAGWKKALVSLAGPVPGIFLGAVLTVVAIFIQKPWLNEFVTLLLIVNGFNLLPVLPMDGGHVLQAVLFCRNRWLDLAFRIAAIVLLLLLGLALSKLLIYVAIGLAIGLPLVLRLSKVAESMRNPPAPLPGDESDVIPPAVADTIISRLRSEQPKGVSNKMLAEQTLSVYETLAARPPGALATTGLLALHAGSFFAAVLFGAILLAGRFGGGWGNLVSAAAYQPQHEYQCEHPTETWSKGAVPPDASPRNLIITSFESRTQASSTFSSLTSQLSGDARLTLFGESLLLSLPADETKRETWFRQFHSYSTNTFVVVSNNSTMLSLRIIANSEQIASNIVMELASYNALPGAHLIPPWSPDAQQPIYSDYVAARKIWMQLDSSESAYWSDASVAGFADRITAAQKRGAVGEIDRLIKQREDLIKRLRSANREKLRASLGGSPMAALVDLHTQKMELEYTNRMAHARLTRQIAAILGEVEYNGDKPAAQAQRLEFSTFGASSTGLIVDARWVSTRAPETSLPALASWLCNQGIAGISYDFVESSYYGDYLDDEYFDATGGIAQ
jgi:Zn-dependent protease